MLFTPLAAVRHRLRVGHALPFDVYDNRQVLLLSSGHMLNSQEFLAELVSRGALVDLDEVLPSAKTVLHASREQLPGLWRQCLDHVGRLLVDAASDARFAVSLEQAAQPVLAMIDRDPDLAIFQVLRTDSNEAVRYGVNHSLHAGIASVLVAQRLGWHPAAVERTLKVALTMNLSMLELQGILAQQAAPLTDDQRESVRSHPQRSAEMLELAGVKDSDWLRGVCEHHERADGTGYPRGCRDVCEVASVVHRADVYTAKLAGRSYRPPMAADRAGRSLFMDEPGHPVVAALVKAFGLFPPGSYVQLASGETGMVVRTGPTLNTPLVSAFTSSTGAPLSEPRLLDTAVRSHAVLGVVAEHEVRAPVDPQRLLQQACLATA